MHQPGPRGSSGVEAKLFPGDGMDQDLVDRLEIGGRKEQKHKRQRGYDQRSSFLLHLLVYSMDSICMYTRSLTESYMKWSEFTS